MTTLEKCNAILSERERCYIVAAAEAADKHMPTLAQQYRRLAGYTNHGNQDHI